MVGLIDVPNSPLGLLCGGSHPTDPRRSLGIVVARLDFCGPVTTKLQSAMQIGSIGHWWVNWRRQDHIAA